MGTKASTLILRWFVAIIFAGFCMGGVPGAVFGAAGNSPAPSSIRAQIADLDACLALFPDDGGVVQADITAATLTGGLDSVADADLIAFLLGGGTCTEFFDPGTGENPGGEEPTAVDLAVCIELFGDGPIAAADVQAAITAGSLDATVDADLIAFLLGGGTCEGFFNPGGENPGGENPGGEDPVVDVDLCLAVDVDEDGIITQADINAAINAGTLDSVADADLIVLLLNGGCNGLITPPGENPGGENPGGENPGGENPGGENPGGENPGGDTGGDTGGNGGTDTGGNTGGGDTGGNTGGDNGGTAGTGGSDGNGGTNASASGSGTGGTSTSTGASVSALPSTGTGATDSSDSMMLMVGSVVAAIGLAGVGIRQLVAQRR